MKKISKKLMAIVSVVLVAIFVCGCGATSKNADPKEAIVGTWKCEWDITDVIKDAFSQEDESVADYFEVEDLVLVINAKFKKDGTCTVKIDEDSVEEFKDALIETMKSGMEKYLDDMLKAFGETRSARDYIKEETGMTFEEYIETFADEMDTEELYENMDFFNSGKYKVENNKLYIWDKDDKMDKDEYVKFTISGDTMKWTKLYGEDADEINDYLPMVFKRK